jgi:aspartate ammonia-lyase
MLDRLKVHTEVARTKLFLSPAVTTALSPLIGYHKAAELAAEMKKTGDDIFTANATLKTIDQVKLKQLMQTDKLVKKGFTINDIKEVI